MRLDGGLMGNLHQVPARIRALEQAGYDGAITAETSNDPFFPLLLAAEHSEKIELMTSIAVAFARSPMNLAQIGHDLNAYSGGRFILGLGSQIKPHITKRFSMPWSSPAARMRELILAMRAIWDCWYKGEKLEFRGEFYTHTLMTPMFIPPDATQGAPRVFLAAVGPLMTRVAGEVADGIIAHGFTTARYLREVTLPAIDEGLERAGRARSEIEVACPVFVVCADDEETWLERRRAVTRQIAFYGSTPAYKPVLDLHGWGALQGELNRLSKQGKWAEMGTLITDEILEQFAVVAEPHRVAGELKKRFAGRIDRLFCTFSFAKQEDRRAAIEELRAC